MLFQLLRNSDHRYGHHHQKKNNDGHMTQVLKSILYNIEIGEWKEPTAIQMQAVPSLLEKRDVMASAPTGSGKSGAFITPALILSAPSASVYYERKEEDTKNNNNKAKKGKKNHHASRQGEIRCLILAPSRELAAQLHREVERLGHGRPGGFSSLLLAKSNINQLNQVGGQRGLDILITTPLRLIDAIEGKNVKLDSLRLIVLDEADRLLDATDLNDHKSGSAHSKTFVSQLDTILAATPKSAIRALFSATITPAVQELSDSILREPINITIQSANSRVGGANSDITQELLFCGKEEGKLLAIRQMVAKGELRPPALVFCQSKERAQALFAELLYDNLHVDVLHAGRSASARETAVKNFRIGQTWILICTDLVARGVDFSSVQLVINYDIPTSGVTYVHRIGRTGRAGRKGKAITFFTEPDLEHLRGIANVMKQSGCEVSDWMLNIRQKTGKDKKKTIHRKSIDTTSGYDKMKKNRKMMSIQSSKKRKKEAAVPDKN
mmetsp:Transcript_16977/g.18872  ORF Transcript_16977/g.18872 Transcript_16977/m.18872 type:complete len:497 (+) Transcript_16977:317-1807(+)